MLVQHRLLAPNANEFTAEKNKTFLGHEGRIFNWSKFCLIQILISLFDWLCWKHRGGGWHLILKSSQPCHGYQKTGCTPVGFSESY